MKRFACFLSLAVLFACTSGQEETVRNAEIVSITFNGKTIAESAVPSGVEGTAVYRFTFNRELSKEKFDPGKVSVKGVPASCFDMTVEGREFIVASNSELPAFTLVTIDFPEGVNFGVRIIYDYSFSFVTAYDRSDKFPRISDEDLLTLVQKQTFKYFWDYGHPVSGLARERLGSDETVTTGGSGFGIMTLPLAVERGFVTHEQAADRLRTIVDFLLNKADRFHGAFSHWLNGTSGKVIPFSSKDNGGDLVETAFMVQGLLAAAGYFDRPEEADIRSGIDEIWRTVEWDWYTRGGQDVLYWHWSPSLDWAMNMQINGWNEGLIAYVLAASSPTHPIPDSAYHKGWARDGGIKNGKTFYGIKLPLGSDLGGPMFFAHYSFMGLDPRGLKDTYADYWEQNVAHARINHAYCAANPGKHAGYSADCWGLTASDIPKGYTASSPTNDKGVIAPTAAIASMPYTPEESLAALREFYYVYGNRLWGDYGFYDAFSLEAAWFATSYIAIDQGPIAVMIENYRSGLLWDCFMKHPDVAAGLKKLGFSSERL